MNHTYDDPLLTPGKLGEHIRKLQSNKQYDYSRYNYHPDSECFGTEINEFLDREDIDRFKHGLQLFQKEYNNNHTYDQWVDTPLEDRANIIASLLSKMTVASSARRLEICQILVYISFGYFNTPIHKGKRCKLLFLNSQLLISCGAFPVFFDRLQQLKQLYLSSQSLPNKDYSNSTTSPLYSEEINACIAMIYLMVESQRYQHIFKLSKTQERQYLSFRKEFMSRCQCLFSLLCQISIVIERHSSNITYRLPIKKLILLLWKCLLFECEGFKKIKEQKQRQLDSITAGEDFKNTMRKNSMIKCSPQNILSYQEKIIKKYPHYQPAKLPPGIDNLLLTNSLSPNITADSTQPKYHVDTVNETMACSNISKWRQSDSNTTLDKDFFRCKLDTPYSVQEADTVFQSNMHFSLANYQLLQIKQRYTKKWQQEEIRRRQHTLPDTPNNVLEALYQSLLPYLPDIVVLLLKLSLRSATFIVSAVKEEQALDQKDKASSLKTANLLKDKRESEICLKATSAIFLLLLKATRSSHILKFEYVSQLLSDSGILLLASRIMGSEEMIYSANNQTDSIVFPCFDSEQDCCELLTDKPGERYIFWTINLTRVMYMMARHKVHIKMLLAQHNTIITLKRLMKIRHPVLEHYVLKLIKGQLPYLGKKWKNQNMRIISSIYLKSTSKLKEEWLSKTHSEADIEMARMEEKQMQLFIHLYHSERYPLAFPFTPYTISKLDLNIDNTFGYQTEECSQDSLEPQTDCALDFHQSPPGTPFPVERPAVTPDQLAERISKLYLDQLGAQFRPIQSPSKISKATLDQPKFNKESTPLARYQETEQNATYLLKTFDLHTVMNEDWQLYTAETIFSKLEKVDYDIINKIIHIM